MGLAKRINFLYLLVPQCQDFCISLPVCATGEHCTGVSGLSGRGLLCPRHQESACINFDGDGDGDWRLCKGLPLRYLRSSGIQVCCGNVKCVDHLKRPRRIFFSSLPVVQWSMFISPVLQSGSDGKFGFIILFKATNSWIYKMFLYLTVWFLSSNVILSFKVQIGWFFVCTLV